MHTVGTREFKDRLTHYLRLVRQGLYWELIRLTMSQEIYKCPGTQEAIHGCVRAWGTMPCGNGSSAITAVG